MNPAEQIRQALQLDAGWRIVVEPEVADQAEHLCAGTPGPGGMPLSDWVVLRKRRWASRAPQTTRAYRRVKCPTISRARIGSSRN